jgi:hypothetical protein
MRACRTGRVPSIGVLLLCLCLPAPSLAWEAYVSGTAGAGDEAEALVIDANGDVIAAGHLYDTTRFYEFAVVKHSGVTGGDPQGHVVAAGSHPGGYVVKLDGQTGDTLWDEEFPDRNLRSVALDRDGNAIAAGSLSSPSGDAGMFAVKLESTTGLPLWPAFELGGTAGQAAANAVAVDADGHVVAAGRMGRETAGARFAVLKLRGRDGADLAPCGDVDGDYDVDTSDLATLRAALAGAPPGVASPERCSVYGGAHDCDLVDRVGFLRWLASQKPRVASVCAAVVE